ncbi:hypothetical protein, partial [Peribacillus muralis]|uniref:hypothetical protein n=1 Tax=Peribacillus muralis TaxID=264697 RepID=UPI00070D2EC8
YLRFIYQNGAFIYDIRDLSIKTVLLSTIFEIYLSKLLFFLRYSRFIYQNGAFIYDIRDLSIKTAFLIDEI